MRPDPVSRRPRPRAAARGPSVVKWGAAACGVPVEWQRVSGEPGCPFYTDDPSDLRQRQLWIDNSAVGNAEGLRGTPLYVYFGNGSTVPSGWTWGGPDPPPGRCLPTPPPPGHDGAGSFVERNIRGQNLDFVAELDALGIPATVCSAYGQHDWASWEREIHAVLPMLLAPIGA